MYVSRINYDNAVIVGKLLVDRNVFWANFKGEQIRVAPAAGRVAVLYVDEACTWTWLPYTSGEVVPAEAVIGGHVASGSPIYVTKMNNGDSILSFGYYSSENAMGYFELNGVRTTTTMNILVML